MSFHCYVAETHEAAIEGFKEPVHRYVDPVDVLAVSEEPPHVGADPAPDVQDPPVLE